MYWGQIAAALSGALLTGFVLSRQGYPIVSAALATVLVYLSVRWILSWIFRVRYWVSNEGYKSRRCSSCGRYIHRLRGDWILTCKRCGWKAGWPGVRWVTHSVFVTQLRRTVVGPSLVIFVLAAFLLFSGAGGLISDFDFKSEAQFSDDEWPESAGVDHQLESTDDGDEPDSSDGSISERTVEQLVYERLNDRRTQRPLSALEWNDRAAIAARAHAVDMAENDYFNHTSLDGETQMERYRFCNGGENALQTWINRYVATGDGAERYSANEELADAIVTGWMNSDPHRERGIYGEWWSSGGTGIAITDEGKVYAVFGFCQ